MIFSAIMEGDLDKVKEAICSGEDPNKENVFGKQPLTQAVQEGNLEIVKYLVENGAKVNSKTKGCHLLTLAMETNKEIVYYLLDKGIDLKLNEGQIPLLPSAAWNNDVDTMKELIERGISINEVGSAGSALHKAIRSGDALEAITYLLEQGIDLELEDHNGYKALYVALKCKYTKAIQLLMENGAMLTEKDIYYLLDNVVWKNWNNLIRVYCTDVLCKKYDELSEEIKTGTLFLLISDNKTEKLKSLIKEGKEINGTFNKKKIVEYAHEEKKSEILSLLSENIEKLDKENVRKLKAIRLEQVFNERREEYDLSTRSSKDNK